MNCKATTTTTAKATTRRKRECADCKRKLWRIFDRETLKTEFLCVFCTRFELTTRRK